MMKKLFMFSILLLAVFLVGCATNNTNYDEFAQCLTDKGAIIYGTDTCSYCLKQKAMFGDSFEKINYVNCQKSPTQCAIKSIEGTPTWIFADASKLVGLQPLEALSEKTECELPGGEEG